MTLRARLTAAFLAVVLGPVVLGAVFVGVTVAAIGADRSAEQLDAGSASVRAAIGAICQRLRVAAESAALLSAGQSHPDAARDVVARGLATAVQVVGVEDEVVTAAGQLPPRPWADCAQPSTEPAVVTAIAVMVDVHDAQARPIGRAYAVEPVNAAFLDRLTAVSGVRVNAVLAGTALSTQDSSVVSTARGLVEGETGMTSAGRLVRRIDPQPGQPLMLSISVPPQEQQGLYAMLVAIVLAAGLVAISIAWWLARSTTQPLTELAAAVERVADGDLTARVPVRSQDEVGRLGATFNRMTREMQGYVQALTASRDQLRGQLGVLGDTLSSTHDLHRILQVILQTAMAATGAQSGVVLLLDPQSGLLEAQVGEGQPNVTELQVRPGEGLLGLVAVSGVPRRGRIDRDGPLLSTREPRCLTYVAVPFAAGGAGPLANPAVADGTAGPPAARGVLALYDRHGFDEFDDADLVTLRTFAGQAAVAVDNVRVHEEAQRLSLTDPLTGLSNYRHLRESLRREVERASRFGRRLAVLALDLDRFKAVNDTHGHAAGDAVLTEFARRLQSQIREVDFAFRQGGEEFVILLPETDATGAAIVAQRLGAVVRREPVRLSAGGSTKRGGDGTAGAGSAGSASTDENALENADTVTEVAQGVIDISVSIGIAVFPDHGPTGQVVLEAADGALYAAKAAGRDTYRIADFQDFTQGAATGSEQPFGASRAAQPPRQSRGG